MNENDAEISEQQTKPSEPTKQDSSNDAQELVRDWQFLFWAFLLWVPIRLVWMYVSPPQNVSLHLGICIGFFFSGGLGFAMRYVLRGKLMA
jgi:hypothetical protein